MSDEEAALIAQYGDDPELLMAIKASMQEEQMKVLVVPDEPPADADPAKVVTIQAKCSDSKLQRRFFKESTRIHDIEMWCRREKQIAQGRKVTIMMSFPKKVFDNPDATLADLKFGK